MKLKQLFGLAAILGMVPCLMLAQDAGSVPPPPRPLPPPVDSSGSNVQPVNGTGRIGVNQPAGSQQRASAQSELRGSEVNVRDPHYPTGWSLGLFGGVNVYQEAQDANRLGGFAIGGDSTGKGADGSGGIKLGYTWTFYGTGSEPIDQWKEEVGNAGLRLSGGIETEAFYVGSNLNPSVGGRSVDVSLDSSVFMMSALLKLQAGDFRIYAGPGAGFTWSHLSPIDGVDMPNGQKLEGDDDVAIAYQVLAGVEYLIDPRWSIFTEYRYLVFDELEFHNSSNTQFGYEQHLVDVGVKMHF